MDYLWGTSTPHKEEDKVEELDDQQTPTSESSHEMIVEDEIVGTPPDTPPEERPSSSYEGQVDDMSSVEGKTEKEEAQPPPAIDVTHAPPASFHTAESSPSDGPMTKSIHTPGLPNATVTHDIEHEYRFPWHLVHLDPIQVDQVSDLPTEESVDLSTPSQSCPGSPVPTVQSAMISSSESKPRSSSEVKPRRPLRVRVIFLREDVTICFDAPKQYEELQDSVHKLVETRGFTGFWHMQLRAYSSRGPLITDHGDWELLRRVAKRAVHPISIWVMDSEVSFKNWFVRLQPEQLQPEDLTMTEFVRLLGKDEWFQLGYYLGLDWRFPGPHYKRQFSLLSSLALLFIEYPAVGVFQLPPQAPLPADTTSGIVPSQANVRNLDGMGILSQVTTFWPFCSKYDSMAKARADTKGSPWRWMDDPAHHHGL